MSVRAFLRRLLAEPGEAEALDRPTAQVGEAFRQMLDDLRGSTERLEDVVFKLSTLNEVVELAARVPQLDAPIAMRRRSRQRHFTAPFLELQCRSFSDQIGLRRWRRDDRLRGDR